jgi:hypothetical protein
MAAKLNIHRTARIEALQAGAHKYQGAPCAHGHDGWRYTQSTNCCQCQTEAKRRQRARERAMMPT